jgi:hypothetical protein
VQIHGLDFLIGKYFDKSLNSLVKICFDSWIYELISISRKQGTLHLNNLYDLLPQYQSKNLTEKLENNWLDEIKRDPNKPSLLRATIRTVGWTPFMIGCLFIPSVSLFDRFCK